MHGLWIAVAAYSSVTHSARHLTLTLSVTSSPLPMGLFCRARTIFPVTFFFFSLFKSNFIIQTTLFPFLESHQPPAAPSLTDQTNGYVSSQRGTEAYPLLTAAHKSCRPQTSFTALHEKTMHQKK